jgi:CheY-like chemotaxis protein
LRSRSTLHNKRCLIIEDDAEIQSFVCTVVELEGGSAAVAGTGAEALVRAGEPGAFDIIVLDFVLRAESGLDVLATLQGLGLVDGCRVVGLSANLNEERRARALELGVVTCLSKPIGAPELRRHLEDALI